MHRIAAQLLFCTVSVLSFSQTPPPNPVGSDPQALVLAKDSLAALTGGVTISDVTLNGTVISAFSADQSPGAITLSAKGWAESRIDISFGQDTRTETRIVTNGVPSGSWKTNSSPVRPIAQHNCWTDAAWFFPVFSSLAEAGSAPFSLSFLGQEQHSGINTQHLQAWQPSVGKKLSTIDVYLDSISHLPVAVSFNTHPDDDVNTNMLVEVTFSNYQPVNGFQVPFQIVRTLNGNPVLQISVTSAVFNTGLPDSLFIL